MSSDHASDDLRYLTVRPFLCPTHSKIKLDDGGPECAACAAYSRGYAEGAKHRINTGQIGVRR